MPDPAPDVTTMLARLWDHQLRDHVSAYSNMHAGRSNSAAHLDSLFFRLVGLSKPALFVEAGAYRAETSVRVKSEHPDARVVAFEANPHNHAKYSEEVDYADRGIEYLNLAVTEQDGTATFHLRTASGGEALREVTGNSSLLKRTDADTEYQPIEVPAVSLDSFFSGDTHAPAAMWIDVEGASGPLLRGASDLLSRTDLVKIEVEERLTWEGQWLSLDVIDHFLRAGFTPLARDIEYENQFNLVFGGNEFARRPEVLAALEYHGNYLTHHLHADQRPAEDPSPGSRRAFGRWRALTARPARMVTQALQRRPTTH